jgi:hypothetical protein
LGLLDEFVEVVVGEEIRVVPDVPVVLRIVRVDPVKARLPREGLRESVLEGAHEGGPSVPDGLREGVGRLLVELFG